MCWPALLGAVGGWSGAIGLASAAVGAYSSIQSSRAQYQADMVNAQIQERNAAATVEEEALTRDAAAIERRRLGERVRAERGELVAKFSAMGVDPAFGTPADLVGDVERAYRIDRSILARNEEAAVARLDKERADYLDAAKLGRSSGASSLKAGSYAAAGSLLDGVSSVAPRWISPATTVGSGQLATPFADGPRKVKIGGG